jgi:phenylalanine-4-hydroxylase
MEFTSKYVAHVPDEKGFIHYSDEEHRVWSILFERQMKLISNRACDEFLVGLKALKITQHSIPQVAELSQKLLTLTGWQR